MVGIASKQPQLQPGTLKPCSNWVKIPKAAGKPWSKAGLASLPLQWFLRPAPCSKKRPPPESSIIMHRVARVHLPPVHPQGKEEDKDIHRTHSGTAERNYGETMDSVKEPLFVFLI